MRKVVPDFNLGRAKPIAEKMKVWRDKEKMNRGSMGKGANRIKDSKPFHPLSLYPILLFTVLTFFPSSISLPTDSTLTTYQLPITAFFQDALDFSDLDARDAKNRPLQTAEAKNRLHQLFSFSVVQLLVSEALPVVASARKILQKLVAPLSEGFRHAKKWLVTKFCWAIAFAVKKFSDFFTLSPFPSTLLSGDSNLRGEGRLTFLPLTTYHLPLSLPLLL